MRHRQLGFVAAALLAATALPAAAEVYTIRLANGTSFESRYQPKQAAWDASLVTFLDETGTEIALPQALIAEVTAQSETKGFGRVLDSTTLDLGFMPNDLDQSQQVMQQQALLNPGGQLIGTPTSVNDFVEPNSLGNGIPLGFGGAGTFNTPAFNPGGGVTTTTPGTTPAPFTQPTNTVTPPPFTTPSPGTAAPPPTTTSPQ